MAESLFTDLLSLFAPRSCAGCGKPVPHGVKFLCPECSWEMPTTGYCSTHDNPVLRKLADLFHFEEAAALFFYSPHSRYSAIIHQMKYHGRWKYSLLLGNMLGNELAAGGLYDTVDMIVPIPLHVRRKLKRGYNQTEYIARGISERLGKRVATECIGRSRHNPSQTKSGRAGRWENVENIFEVRRAELLEGKHILLVDDVLTTGATLVSCAETIREAVPSCRISVATLAVSSYELFPSSP